ncbi:hypothetical protein ACFQZE_11560 [Paenibacillus sp. GCM10027627]|uniref:LiaF transmembrane domain-containing protein n=1 Tax=unclassified Paenibacillus TaxID=185978 RepID=UPI0036268C0F
MNGKSALGVMLIVVGALAVLNFFDLNLGGIISFLLPFILIGFGIVGWMNNKKTVGGILIVIGAVVLLGKLGGWLMLLLAVGLIAGGVSLFKSNKRKSY